MGQQRITVASTCLPLPHAQAVGPDFDLMQESNMRLTLAECLELASRAGGVEVPLVSGAHQHAPPDALEGYLRVREALPHVMVSGGEAGANRFEFKSGSTATPYDIVQPDCNVTGVTEAWQIARMPT